MNRRRALSGLGLSTGKRARLYRILHRHGLGNGTAMFLPYDQGLEYGCGPGDGEGVLRSGRHRLSSGPHTSPGPTPFFSSLLAPPDPRCRKIRASVKPGMSDQLPLTCVAAVRLPGDDAARLSDPDLRSARVCASLGRQSVSPGWLLVSTFVITVIALVDLHSQPRSVRRS